MIVFKGLDLGARKEFIVESYLDRVLAFLLNEECLRSPALAGERSRALAYRKGFSFESSLGNKAVKCSADVPD